MHPSPPRYSTHSFLALFVAAGAICSAPAEGGERLAIEDLPVISAERLSSMRGGFVGTIDGKRLEVSFGIERIVSVDDEIVGATSFRIPSLTSLDALKALPLNALQSGAGNQVSADVRSVGGTLALIQNTLDNQVLRQVTIIDANVRNLELHRASQFGAALSNQLINSLR